MSISPSPPTWKRETRVIVTVIALLVAAALVYLSRSVIPQLVLAAVLAYIFQPLATWLERRGVKRGLAAGLCVLLLILIVAFLPVLLIPAIVNGVRAILDVLNRLPQLLQQILDNLLANRPILQIATYRIDLGAVALALRDQTQQAVGQLEVPALDALFTYILQGVRTAGGVLSTAAGIATGVFSFGLSTMLLLLYMFYLTKDSSRLSSWLDSLILPEYRPEAEEVGRRLNVTWKSFFRGQILLSATVGMVVFVSTAALGLPGSLVLGILAGILEVVPTLGPILAMVPAVLLALIQGSNFLPVSNLIFALIVVGVYVLIQQIENNVLVPRIMGQSLDLHPIIVLVGVVVGASFAGVLGAFLAAPVLASLKILGWYAHAKLTDQDMFARAGPSEMQLVPTQAMTGMFGKLFGRKKPQAPPATDTPNLPAVEQPAAPVDLAGASSSNSEAA